jgi:hypothetical protein
MPRLPDMARWPLRPRLPHFASAGSGRRSCGPDPALPLGRVLYRSLTLLRRTAGHGGNPPPRANASGAPFPPSATMSRKDEEKVDAPTIEDSGCAGRWQRTAELFLDRLRTRWPAVAGGRASAPVAAAGSRHGRDVGAEELFILDLQDGGQVPPPRPMPRPDAGGASRPNLRLTFDRAGATCSFEHASTCCAQAHAHGGNPPPHQERPHGRPPPSASLSSRNEQRVNAGRHAAGRPAGLGSFTVGAPDGGQDVRLGAERGRSGAVPPGRGPVPRQRRRMMALCAGRCRQRRRPRAGSPQQGRKEGSAAGRHSFPLALDGSGQGRGRLRSPVPGGGPWRA